MDRETVGALIRAVVGSSAEAAACDTLNEQPGYRVLAVTLRDGARLVIKLAGEQSSYGASFGRTAAIHRLVREKTSVPVADILLADDTLSRWPWRVLVERWLPGTMLAEAREGMTGDAQRSIMAQIGDAAAQIHGIAFSGCGPIGADGRVSDPRDALDGITAHARRIIPRPVLLACFLDALAPHADLFRGDRRAGLAHEDLHAYNILVRQEEDGWRLAGILDFDKAWAGPPDADLARMALWGLTGAGFWEGYGPRYMHPLREALLQLLWCLEVAWEDSAHRATTAGVLQKLGLKGLPF